MTEHWAVIPSCCRPDEVVELINQLTEDGVEIALVDTGYELPLHFRRPKQVHVLRYPGREKNISKWWNLGLTFVDGWVGHEDYVVAVLNDDVRVSSMFVQQLAGAIKFHDVPLAYPDVYGLGRDFVCKDIPGGPRMSGFAFALRGSAGIRADESLAWWYGDNDIDWQARQLGGTVSVGHLNVQHLYANSTTVGELAEQAGRDRETFVKKWGQAPW